MVDIVPSVPLSDRLFEPTFLNHFRTFETTSEMRRIGVFARLSQNSQVLGFGFVRRPCLLTNNLSTDNRRQVVIGRETRTAHESKTQQLGVLAQSGLARSGSRRAVVLDIGPWYIFVAKMAPV